MRLQALRSSTEDGDLTTAFAIWPTCMEQGLASASNARVLKHGRGSPCISSEQPAWSMEVV
eukprot:15468024-Alexandrium_andersonii.AAC.1